MDHVPAGLERRTQEAGKQKYWTWAAGSSPKTGRCDCELCDQKIQGASCRAGL